jgi:hypothetical protein
MNPAWPPFVLTLIAFFFLYVPRSQTSDLISDLLQNLLFSLLASVSSPIVRNFNFLHAETAGGVSFGLWGWCIDDGGSCTPVKLGYGWDAQVIHWLTYALIFIPIGMFASFLLPSLTLTPRLPTHQPASSHS